MLKLLSTEEHKEELQNWLSGFGFYYRIDIEPTPQFKFTKDELVQRFRKIIFKINKRYLKSSFPKWDANNKFWMIGFKEGKEELKNIHYHLLVHAPPEIHKRKMGKSLILDFNLEWVKTPSINPFTGQKRPYRTARRTGLPFEGTDYQLPLRMECVSDVEGANRYASKDYNPHNFDYEDYFIIGLDDSSNPVLTQRRKQMQKVS